MIKMLPGTNVELELSEWENADQVLDHMFLSGGLMLSQVSRLAGIAPHEVQNWVRRGFVSPPRQKLYSRRQLSRIFIINMLRSTLQIDRICALLAYINGHLDDESDDSIDDTRLYSCLVQLCAKAEQGKSLDPMELLKDYIEPFPGARLRIARVLEVMVTAYKATIFKQRAEAMLMDLDLDTKKD